MHVNAEHKLFGNQNALQYLLVCSGEERESYRFGTNDEQKMTAFLFFGKLGQLKGTYFALCYCIFYIYFI